MLAILAVGTVLAALFSLAIFLFHLHIRHLGRLCAQLCRAKPQLLDHLHLPRGPAMGEARKGKETEMQKKEHPSLKIGFRFTLWLRMSGFLYRYNQDVKIRLQTAIFTSIAKYFVLCYIYIYLATHFYWGRPAQNLVDNCFIGDPPYNNCLARILCQFHI